MLLLDCRIVLDYVYTIQYISSATLMRNQIEVAKRNNNNNKNKERCLALNPHLYYS